MTHNKRSAVTGESRRVEGVILRTYPSREADLVLRILSRDQGKISVIAKGARKNQKKFGARFDLFDRGAFELLLGRGSLQVVAGFLPEPAWRRLREDLDKLAAASFLCEAFDLLTYEDERNEAAKVFELLLLGLEAIDNAASAREALRAAYLSSAQLLELSGYSGEHAGRAPGTRALRSVIDSIEDVAERKLETKSALLETISRLKSEE